MLKTFVVKVQFFATCFIFVAKIKGFLSIICENSLRESQAEALRGNLVMETSKEDKKNHGFGVKNIKRVVREYGGEVSSNVVDDMFSVSILIPIEV